MNNEVLSFSLTAQQVIDNMLEAVVISDSNNIIQSVNPAFCSTTGYSPDEVIGKSPSILKSGEHKSMFYKKCGPRLNNQEPGRAKCATEKRMENFTRNGSPSALLKTTTAQ
jgi:PAS domain S-box-containing protein